ncbi:hypothetical protein BOTBODRAFT_30734 [Botryobasidium botryosum FD-172 SS1]|uniref:rRNA biogenesis protein RRP36 n=1 Tax=Botryobasidium botryosum (strain FD-172 SS1) TaxID=930990 RepID=A0A067MM78_BOTB1|nr:hypothetical protein BOTBODRAFT_30734 [Botryobasidium botryosum FD-172 SS1]
MPRRARPAARIPPRSSALSNGRKQRSLTPTASSTGVVRTLKRKHPEMARRGNSQATVNLHEDAQNFADQGGESSEEDASELPSAKGEVYDSDDEDIDGPRVAQWVDEDELDDGLGSGDDNNDNSEAASDEERRDMRTLEHDLSSLPFGALLKAQNALAESMDEDSQDDGDWDTASGDGDFHQDARPGSKGKEVDPNERRERRKIEKRAHKHAPMEMSSKRPVTRRRAVVEVPRIERRDPRFSSLSGEFSSTLFDSSYGFLSDIQKSEVSTLRGALSAARKQLANSPRHLREERQAEVTRLERALKRSESTVERNERERRNQEVLKRAKKEELSKRTEGKRQWHMKDSEKRALLLKGKFEALKATGGQRAVKKAIEKKKKKVSQKEKKSRPFAKGGEVVRGGEGGERKRRRVA